MKTRAVQSSMVNRLHAYVAMLLHLKTIRVHLKQIQSAMFGMGPRSRLAALLFAAMSLGLGAASAIGQSYPTKPIRIIVPSPAAGGRT